MSSITRKTAKELRTMAKELGIKGWHKLNKREELVAAIAEKNGWSNERPEIIEFLVNGGKIKQLPGFEGVKPKPVRKDSGVKIQTTKPRRIPRKVAKPVETNMVTLRSICEELGVEGRVARRKLRNSDIPKPGSQWEWSKGHEDIKRVKELLR